MFSKGAISFLVLIADRCSAIRHMCVYGSGCFSDIAELGQNAIREELRAICLMVMQHRYVLDLMTAMDGGVCAKIGASCCTFIPLKPNK